MWTGDRGRALLQSNVPEIVASDHKVRNFYTNFLTPYTPCLLSLVASRKANPQMMIKILAFFWSKGEWNVMQTFMSAITLDKNTSSDELIFA